MVLEKNARLSAYRRQAPTIGIVSVISGQKETTEERRLDIAFFQKGCYNDTVKR